MKKPTYKQAEAKLREALQDFLEACSTDAQFDREVHRLRDAVNPWIPDRGYNTNVRRKSS